MRFWIRAALAVAFCIAAGLGVISVRSRLNSGQNPSQFGQDSNGGSTGGHTQVATFPDPNAPGTGAQVFIDRNSFDSNITSTAFAFTGPVQDRGSLDELREAIRGRGRRGIAELRAEHDRLQLDSADSFEQSMQAMQLRWTIAYLYMYDGKLAEAVHWIDRALELSRLPGVGPEVHRNLIVLRGICGLRQGEVENCLECLGPSSCIFPIAPEAAHRNQAGSREAIRQFTAYLDECPGDLQVRWLLNLAYMTLGEYPQQVPPRYRFPLDSFRSKLDVGRFQNVAARVGLTVRGPNLAGGCIFDDFTGDDLPDLLTTSFDIDSGASLFVNRGDGTFEDRSIPANLSRQIYSLNAARADYDNDGDPDVVLIRGGWEKPARLSLLRNDGHGRFEDVTAASGLAEPIASESGAWGDYDNDGFVDLFVCGEYVAPPPALTGGSGDSRPDPRNRCRLYHNERDGTFKDVAEEAGVRNELCAKGCAWGDFDDDGRLDLFVSNMGGPSRLYKNMGNGRFHDASGELGIAGSPVSFSCLFWDYDNDGRLDLLACDYKATMSEVIASYLRLSVKDADHPHLYRNLGPQGFRDVSSEVGLARPLPAMSMNCGDIDNDGFLDLYFGVGWMTYSSLVPGVMFKNVAGLAFEDVTLSSGTGHLQKGHGVSFADWNGDGNLDLFLVLGGGFLGDGGYDALFQNPGHGRHWLKIKLIGTKTNRSALGTRIRVDLPDGTGQTRSVHRVIGNNGSFGGNSLVELVGLLDARSVPQLTVTWPTSHTTQVFREIAADQTIEITEGVDSIKVIPPPPPTRSKRPTAAPSAGKGGSPPPQG